MENVLGKSTKMRHRITKSSGEWGGVGWPGRRTKGRGLAHKHNYYQRTFPIRALFVWNSDSDSFSVSVFCSEEEIHFFAQVRVKILPQPVGMRRRYNVSGRYISSQELQR